MDKKRLQQGSMAVVLTAALLAPTGAFGASASDFSDFPSDWSTQALTNAVDNGLLGGYNGKIDAKGKLTRAQMAAIINRAFGSTAKASLNGYTDVGTSSWYRDDMAKALQMGTFVGVGDGKLNPDANITRQEALAVLARAFAIDDADADALDKFTDADDVSAWAQKTVAAMVKAGYINGYEDGTLNPKGTITRAEFAAIMDNIAKDYITQAGSYDKVADGNVIVRAGGVDLSGMTIKGDLILADGVGTDDVNLDGVTVQGRIVVRGGDSDAIKLKNVTARGGIVVTNPNRATGLVIEDGSIASVTAKTDLVIDGNVSSVTVKDGANVTVKDGTVRTITVDADSTGSAITVEKGATVTTVEANGKNAKVSGEGKVTTVKANADGAAITVPSAKIEVAEGTTGVTAGGVTVEPGKDVTINSKGDGIVNGSTGGGGTSGGGGGSVSSTIAMTKSIKIDGNDVYYATTSKSGATFTVGGSEVEATKIGDTDVYYYSAKEISGKVYGTDTLSYTELYAGDLENADGQYDAVTSATTNKNTIFSNMDSTEPDDNGYKINGAKNVPIQVDAKQYTEAKVLQAADALDGADAKYTKAAEVADATTTVPTVYKTLDEKGTYGAFTSTNTQKITDATLSVSATERWGDYVLKVDENSTNHLRVGKVDPDTFDVGSNTLAAVVEAEKGGETFDVGMKHLQNIWVQPYEIAFDVTGDNANADTAKLKGATVKKITYYSPKGIYEYDFAEGALVKPLYPGEAKISAEVQGNNQIKVTGIPAEFKDVTIKVYYGGGHSGEETVVAAAAKPDDNGVITLDDGNTYNDTKTYTILAYSSNYGELKTQIVAYMKKEQVDTLNDLIAKAQALVDADSSLTELQKQIDSAKALVGKEGVTYDQAERQIKSLQEMIKAQEMGNQTFTGTHEVEIFGSKYNVTATITVDGNDNNKIKSVTWNHDNQNAQNNTYLEIFTKGADKWFTDHIVGLSADNAVDTIDKLEVTKQDAVSGASVTTRGVDQAIINAYKQAVEKADAVEMTKTTIAGNEVYYATSDKADATFTADGQKVTPTKIDGTNVYYHSAKKISGKVYGTDTLTWAELYAGNTDSADQYTDVVSSATARHDGTFGNANVIDKTDSGYKINGVKNVPVQVDAQQYTEAKVLEAAKALDGTAAKYTKAAEVADATTTEPATYKPLNADGTYGAFATKDAATTTAGTASIIGKGHWDPYVITVTDSATSKLNENITSATLLGVVLEGTDKSGAAVKAGMQFNGNLWAQGSEIGLNIGEIEGYFNAAKPGNVADVNKFADGSLTKVTYITTSGAYTYTFEKDATLKQLYDGEISMTTSTNEDRNQLTITGIPEGWKNVKVDVYKSVRGSAPEYVVTQQTPTDGVVTLENNKTFEVGPRYNVVIHNDEYADASTRFSIPAMNDDQKESLTKLLAEAAKITDQSQELKDAVAAANAVLTDNDPTSEEAKAAIDKLTNALEDPGTGGQTEEKTYEGTAEVVPMYGFNYNVTATVTVDPADNNKITKVSWAHDNSNPMNDEYLEKFTNGADQWFTDHIIGLTADNAVDTIDNLEVTKQDAVSGATVTTKGVDQAIINAYKQATGNTGDSGEQEQTGEVPPEFDSMTFGSSLGQDLYYLSFKGDDATVSSYLDKVFDSKNGGKVIVNDKDDYSSAYINRVDNRIKFNNDAFTNVFPTDNINYTITLQAKGYQDLVLKFHKSGDAMTLVTE
ncbi:MAG: S-layer homology domain-containing protein [Peptococcaceae bacterium]|nr:S-layer homology domain-containing protein [Peptococcaceae bacterium]